MSKAEFGCSSEPSATDDAALVGRIAAAYREAIRTPLGDTDSMWLVGPLLEMRRDVHHALVDDDPTVISRLLRDPGETDLFYGFENLSRTFRAERLPSLDRQAFAAIDVLGLIELGRAVGASRVNHHDQPEPAPPDVETLLVAIDNRLGLRVEFPNPFPGEIGVSTSRGVMSYRACPALYQAWRLRQLAGTRRKPRVLEIGGGLGRTAYYARRMGILDYTIVDLPITLVAQANFLGRTLGADGVQLFGEGPERQDLVKLVPPSAFLESETRYDIVLNVDSMTEMARPTAQAYCDAISARAETFLSINHEGLSFTVAELVGDGVFQRSPYWMRPGYVEELSGLHPSSTLAVLSARVARKATDLRRRARFGRAG